MKMAQLKHKIKNNLEEFIGYVFEKLDAKEDFELMKELLVGKARPFKVLQRWSKQYGGEFVTKKFSNNTVINDFSDKTSKEEAVKVVFSI